ncbi:ABC transporter permease [Heyndrickxia acidicola]|uniref:Transport permease protein n=1 Tax=Heyndrickxia acidicola TaxID=209389 RepID=A0ABU6MGE2_9BACI|nr:ABC transporter permease [Heyndrickxia acidicola]MED1203755.1 ABC transporter permease [Heyndrickxia acidicola]
MKSLFTVIKEQFTNFYLINRLSLYEMKSDNKDNLLGLFWVILNPMIQIGIYWFVFGYGIRAGKHVGHVPYFAWLIAGIVVWFFINPSIIEGSRSVYSRLRMISRMSFPLSAIPTYVIFAKFYQHLMLLAIIIIILQFYGYHVSVHYLALPYYMVATILLLFALALITSTLSTIVRDVHQIVQSLMRVLFYITPILWVQTGMSKWIVILMKANPLYYIIEGYRNCLLGKSWYFVDHWFYTLYFWAVLLVLLWIGSVLHMKFRDRLVDYL